MTSQTAQQRERENFHRFLFRSYFFAFYCFLPVPLLFAVVFSLSAFVTNTHTLHRVQNEAKKATVAFLLLRFI